MSAEILCEQLNKFINTLQRKKRKKQRINIHGLTKTMKGRNMSDKEILDKYLELEHSCLSDSEKNQVNGYVILI